MRTGLGVSKVRNLYWTLDPDLIVAAGPWQYGIGLAATASVQASEKRFTLWDYKFDSTSVGMRSFAMFLKLAAWPQCVFQNQLQCPELPSDSLSEATVFSMRDALVDAVRLHNTSSYSSRRFTQPYGAENAITLRVESVWRDHAHDFILPEVFSHSVKGTTQAMYFSSLTSIGAGLCSRTQTFRPYTCNSLVANYRRLPGGNAQTNKLMAKIIEDRVAALQAANPTAHVDFLLIEVRNDASKGGPIFRDNASSTWSCSLRFAAVRTLSVVVMASPSSAPLHSLMSTASTACSGLQTLSSGIPP